MYRRRPSSQPWARSTMATMISSALVSLQICVPGAAVLHCTGTATLINDTFPDANALRKNSLCSHLDPRRIGTADQSSK
jgi:hypothetical protein